jgi:hypothetical protein
MQFNADTVQRSYLIVDLWKRFIPARIAKLQAVDKIMDKPWKTRWVSHNLPTILPTTFSNQF